MDGQTAVVVAAAAIMGSFPPLLALASWLARTGRLGDPARPVAFVAYAPAIAGVLSLGTFGIHVWGIVDHAAHSVATGDTVLFLCAIGAVTAHPVVADATVLGFLPVGLASLVVTPLQGVWSWPRAWRSHPIAIAGGVVAVISLAITVIQLAMQPLLVDPGGTGSRIGDAGSSIGDAALVALAAEGLLLVAIAVLLAGRPRRVMAALEVRAIDAFVATGMAIVSVGILSVVALAAGHAAH